MSLYNIYFSPTGGTKKVADIIASQLDKDHIDLDMIKKPDAVEKLKLDQNDICIISVPSYGGRVPAIVLEHLNKTVGNGAKTILVAVYGNRHIDDTLIELYDSLNNRGFFRLAAIEAVAEHSLMHQFAAGRPDTKDKNELYNFAVQIKLALKEDRNYSKLHIPGSHHYKEYNGVPIKPITTSRCNKCGICAEECPVNAISKDNPQNTDKEICISCMHCVSVCPEKARQTSKIMTFVASQKFKKVCSGRKENKLYLN